MAQILPSGDVAIQTTNIVEKVKKLRKMDGWTKVLESKAGLIQKWYKIVALGIAITKIDFEKIKKTKKKLVTQNASLCIGIKFEIFFRLLFSKKKQINCVTNDWVKWCKNGKFTN